MERENFKFTSGGKDYVLWAWKGDYKNLGAGAELGIYEDVFGPDGHWGVDKSLAMQMSMTLQYTDPKTGKLSTIFTYDPSDPQWWITGFDPKYQDVKAADLTAYFTVQFDSKEMYDDFYKKYGQGERANPRWTFLTPNGYTAHKYMATFKF